MYLEQRHGLVPVVYSSKDRETVAVITILSPQHMIQHRSSSLLVSARNRVKQQSGYEPEPRNELVTSYTVTGYMWETSSGIKYTTVGNAVHGVLPVSS